MSLRRNATWGYGREVVEAGVFLSLTPWIASSLGAEGFGLWSLAWATASLLSLLDLGLAQTVVKFVAAGRDDDPRELGGITATLWWTYLALCVIATGLILVGSSWATTLPGIPADRASDFRAALVVLGLRGAIGLPVSALHGILTGLGVQRRSHAVRGVETSVYALLAFAAGTATEPRLVHFAAASLASIAVTGPLAYLLVRRASEIVSFSPLDVRLSRVPEFSRFAGHFFVIQAAMLLYGRADAFLVQAFLPVAAVGVWSVASRVSEKAGAFCRQLANALTPELAHAGSDPRKLARLYRDQAQRSIAIATPILLGLALLSAPLVDAWMGPDFTAAGPVLAILTGAVWISVLHAPSAGLLSMTGDEAFVSRVFVGAQVGNLTLTAVLLPLLGLPGAALATLATSLLVDVGIIQRRVAQRLGGGVLDFYRQMLLRLGAPSFALILTAMWAAPVARSGLLGVAVLEALFCLVFAAILKLPVLLSRGTRTRSLPASSALRT